MTLVRARRSPATTISRVRYAVGVLGLGYVGLPQAVVFARTGQRVLGVDVSAPLIRSLRAGHSPVDTVTGEDVRQVADLLHVTDDTAELTNCSTIIICVPTPVNADGQPDLSALRVAAGSIAVHLTPGKLVVVESTVHPGCTETVVKPVLESSGLTAGLHFNLAFAPERMDPGNAVYGPANTPRVIGGYTAVCAWRTAELYAATGVPVHLTSDLRSAEAAKILENTYRQVNLALIHEFADYCEAQGIDVNAVVAAAATKPFGFQPFFPGAGVGGHCIPVDPMYLAASARAQRTPMRLVELAQRVNDERPVRVAERCGRVLISAGCRPSGARVAVLGLTYKPDVADVRNSPAVPLIRRLREMGVDVVVHDPYVDGVDVDGDTLASVSDLVGVVESADLVVVAQRHVRYDDGLLGRARSLLDAGGRSAGPRPVRPGSDG